MVTRWDAWPTRTLVTGLLSAAFLLASALAVRPWVALWAGHGASLHQAARRALVIDPANDRFHAVLATVYQYDLFLRDYASALGFYHSTLRSNPLDTSSWLHLSKLYRKLERPLEAERALRLAVRLAPGNAALVWDATTAFLEEGQVPDALQMLTRYLLLSGPGESVKAYRLARMLATSDEVLDRIIPSTATHYTRYMNYLLQRNRPEDAFRVWQRLARMPLPPGEHIESTPQLQLVDQLIAARQAALAHEVWSHVMKALHPGASPDGTDLVSNGGFEDGGTLGRGFDWKIEGAPGITCDFDTSVKFAGRRSLRISVGKTQTEFSNVSQLIPVQANSIYALEARMKTRDLSGTPGIAVEVIDSQKGTLARTEPMKGTKDWTRVWVTFRTPAHTQSIRLRVHRGADSTLTQPSEATAWIDNVSLTRAH